MVIPLIPTKSQWRGWSLPSKLTAVGAYLGVLGLVITVLVTYWTTRDRLSRADFHGVYVRVSAHGAALQPESQPPELLDMWINIGDLIIHARPALDRKGVTPLPSVKNPIASFAYTDTSPDISGIESHMALSDLVGRNLSAHVPLRAFHLKSMNAPLVGCDLRLSIADSDILVETNAEGRVETIIAKDMIYKSSLIRR